MKTINTEVAGILNVTPDSFSDGGLYIDPTKAIAHAMQMFDEGASMVDVGAESTRPGAIALTPKQEWLRLKLVLNELVPTYIGKISVDTYHPETICRTVKNFGSITANDVTGYNNPEMMQITAELGIQCIVSHLPKYCEQNLQQAHADKPIDSINQVRDELLEKREELISAGIKPDMITVDPGVGFGKTMRTNWQLLSFADHVPGINVMIGYSRKRFLYTDEKTGEIIPALMSLKEFAKRDKQNGLTSSANIDKHEAWIREIHEYAGTIAVNAGTKLLRVHDVAFHYDLIKRLGKTRLQTAQLQ